MSDNFINSSEFKKIFSFHNSIASRIIARESNSLEFKESFNWLSKDKYAKSIAAFANNRGGYLVFGVKNQPRELTGLQSENFETIDEEKITSYLNGVLSPEIQYEKFTLQLKGKTVGIIHTYKAQNKPVICTKTDGELRESDIYYRYNARSEKIKYPELKILIDEVRAEERKDWMQHFEKISKVGPTNAAILDVVGGEISGRGGTLVIDKKLIPKLKFIKEGRFQESGKPVLKLIGDVKPVSVFTGKGGKKSIESVGFQITNNPDALVVRLEEADVRKKYPLNYQVLSENLAARYADFKRNNKYNELRKKLLKDKRFSITRQLDPNNPKSAKQSFYSELVYREFDKHYKKKVKKGVIGKK